MFRLALLFLAPALFAQSSNQPGLSISGLEPRQLEVRDLRPLVRFHGTDIRPSDSLEFDGVALPIAGSADSLYTWQALIPLKLLQTARTVSLRLVREGFASDPIPFSITPPQPWISRVGNMILSPEVPPVRISGGAFLPTTTVLMNGKPIPTSFLGEDLLLAHVPAARRAESLAPELILANGPARSRAFQLTGHPGIQIAGVVPSSLKANGIAQSVTATLVGLQAGDTLRLNDFPLPYKVLDDTHVRVDIPAARLTTPASTRLVFCRETYSCAGIELPIRPALRTQLPTSLPVGSPTTIIDITLDGLAEPLSVDFQLYPGFGAFLPVEVTSTRTARIIFPSEILSMPNHGVLLIRSGGVGLPEPLPFAVLGSAPVLTSITPAVLPSSILSPFNLKVSGVGFTKSAKVRWNGQDLPTTLLDATTLSAEVPGDFLFYRADVSIEVAQGLGLSNALTLRRPSILPATTAPAFVPQGAGTTLLSISLPEPLLNDTAIIRLNGTALETNILSPTTARLVVPPAFLRNPGEYPLTLSLPDLPDTLLKTTFSVLASTTRPRISEISPSSLDVGSPQTLVNVSGLGFSEDSVVRLNGLPLPTTFVSASALAVLLPASSFLAPATLKLDVTDSGVLSDPLPLSVVTPDPLSYSPSYSGAFSIDRIYAGLPNPLVIFTNYPGQPDHFLFDGQPVPISYDATSGAITVQLPADLLLSPGPRPSSVAYPKLTTNEVDLWVEEPGRPQIRFLVQSRSDRPQDPTVFYILADGITRLTQAYFEGQQLRTRQRSDNALEVVIPGDPSRPPGAYAIHLSNGPGRDSEPATFTFTKPN